MIPPKHFTNFTLIHTPMGDCCLLGVANPIGSNLELSVLPKDATIEQDGAKSKPPHCQSLENLLYLQIHSRILKLIHPEEDFQLSIRSKSQ